MSAPSADALEDAARRIEYWLLHSGVQLAAGPERGGVAGWLDRTGQPEFIYLEITGYYLTAMAWLASGAACSAANAVVAVDRGGRALDWMRRATADRAVPPTRLYLSEPRDDWRNAAIFSFDLAMAARGAARFGAAAGTRARSEELLRDLGARLVEICGDGVPLRSHALRDERSATVPDRWSTRPGPHHLKAAAALLRLPAGIIDGALVQACHQTIARWADSLAESWPGPELHPLLYGLEGLMMLNQPPSEETLDLVERVFESVLRLQGADGSLPAEATPTSALVRSDVLAQAVRIGTLLSISRRPPHDGGLDGLAEALLRHVRPDGGVLFSLDQDVANAWSAMFAHQALVLYARAMRGVSVSPRVAESLI